MTQAIRVPVSRGIEWIVAGWRGFTASPGMWIVLAIIWILITLALQMLPLVGSLAGFFVAPILAGGLLMAADDVHHGRELDLECLFRPVTDTRTRNPVLVLSAIYLGANVAVIVFSAIVLIAGAGMAMLRHEGGMFPMDPAQVDPAVLFALGGAALLIGLVVFALLLLILVLFYFAIPLVTFGRMEPGRAIADGTRALLRNWAPLTVVGLLYVPLSILASLPLMLGWLILLPMTFGIWYASYRDVFALPGDDDSGDAEFTNPLPPPDPG